MSDKRQMERPRRPREFDDDDRFERGSRRYDRPRQPKPLTKYVFRVNGKPRPPAEVRCERDPKLGDVLSTSEGPHLVVEVYWSGSEKRGWKADVLLRPVEKKEAEPVKKSSGSQGCPKGPRGRKGPVGKPASRSASRKTKGAK